MVGNVTSTNASLLIDDSELLVPVNGIIDGLKETVCTYPVNYAEVDYISTYIYLLAIPTICVLGAGAAAPMFFELTNDECGRLRTSFLRDNKYYKEYYVTFGYLIVLLLIPWTVMIILNVFVVKAVHKAYKIRRSMQGGKNNQEEKDRRNSLRCTLMAIAMVLTFLVFNVVAAVNNLAETVFEVSLGFWSPIGNLLICLNR
uniref:G-protein coupled receptors family 1 profile domain-containing protein n=2 Tax=Caenorhabditis japonica TaxID=281687 RepID=A0A8R1HXZ0_CAEJA